LFERSHFGDCYLKCYLFRQKRLTEGQREDNKTFVAYRVNCAMVNSRHLIAHPKAHYDNVAMLKKRQKPVIRPASGASYAILLQEASHDSGQVAFPCLLSAM
jgi:hypothetical protein